MQPKIKNIRFHFENFVFGLSSMCNCADEYVYTSFYAKQNTENVYNK